MEHQLNFNPNTGKHSFMSVKERAWHNLGQIIDRYPTSNEAIQHAGLDYMVENAPYLLMIPIIIIGAIPMLSLK